MSLDPVIVVLTAAAFLYYGLHCLFHQKMVIEFRRFGLDRQRILTGILQLLGSFGLLLGEFLSAIIGLLAAGGLTLLMILGFGVRLKMRDGFRESFPSFFFSILNAYISYYFYSQLL